MIAHSTAAAACGQPLRRLAAAAAPRRVGVRAAPPQQHQQQQQHHSGAAVAPCAAAPCRRQQRRPRCARARAGADAQAFEALLGAADAAAAALPQQRQRGGAAAASDAPDAATAAARAEADEPEGLLDPILPLHRGAERFAWAAPDGALLEVIHRPGVPQDGDAAAAAGGGSGVVRWVLFVSASPQAPLASLPRLRLFLQHERWCCPQVPCRPSASTTTNAQLNPPTPTNTPLTKQRCTTTTTQQHTNHHYTGRRSCSSTASSAAPGASTRR